MNQIFRYFFLLTLSFFGVREASAQGFTKLQDKYGQFGSQPLQQKSADGTVPTGDSTVPEGMIVLNGIDVDIRDMVEQIAKMTGKNFIINERVSGKITIISEKPMTIEMAYQAFLSALQIKGFTIVETPAGLLNIVPQKEATTMPTDLYKDESPETDKFITRIIQLENISANELYQIINPLKSKNANMFAYPTTNSIVVTDTGANINHLIKLVHELDQEGPQEVLEIIPILNADAKDIAQKVTTIFENKDQQNAVRRPPIFRRPGAAGQELDDVQAISKVIADERTNSVIIMGTKRSILKVKALIARLDRSISGVEGSIHVYYLKHANAEEMAKVLGSLDQPQNNAKKTGGAAGTPNARQVNVPGAASAVQLEGGFKVVADVATNSLIITASPKDYTTLIDKVISKLDIVRAQVYLEAVIMSLDVTKSTKLGVNLLGGLNWSPGAGGPGMNFFSSVLPLPSNELAAIATGSGGFLGGQGGVGGVVSDQTISFTDSSGNTVSVPAIGGLIQALKADTDVNVLSTPSIMTLDKQEAEIKVGQTIPTPSGTTVGTGSTTFGITREDTGIMLKITPQISEGDSVNLKIEQEISSLAGLDPSFGATIDEKRVTTTVLARNRQTIVLGGLIDDSNIVETRKVPLLGDVPVLGTLFKNRTTTRNKSNLLVFITPFIVRSQEDYQAILKKKIEERNQFIDMNFGTKQKKQIRESIYNHARDLLDFKCGGSDLSPPCANQNQVLTIAPVPAVSSTPQAQPIPAANQPNYSSTANGKKTQQARGNKTR